MGIMKQGRGLEMALGGSIKDKAERRAIGILQKDLQIGPTFSFNQVWLIFVEE